MSLDQLTKTMVVRNIPLYREAFGLFGGLVDIVHQRNLGMAFSMGSNLNANIRFVLLVVFPVLILIGLSAFVARGDIDSHFRWPLSGIIGGGMGNIFDRIFRPEGVVDFIKINIFNHLGINYFPVINVADSFITICAVLIGIFYFIEIRNKNSLEAE